MTDEYITIESDLIESDEDTDVLSAPEFTCHCCYEVLVDPTTLNCGHSFCRHCVAQWLHSSKRNECPECRASWQGFPKVNILLSQNTLDLISSRQRRFIVDSLWLYTTLQYTGFTWLWATNLGKSLFLQFGLREFPRLTFLYLYLFDYQDTFLPFIHTCCPAHTTNKVQDVLPDNMLEPSQHQWMEFRVKVCFLPYLLLIDFAWQWMSVHYWMSRIVIVNAMLMTILEFF
ncbi:bifunctional apoptosis regulator-like [Rhinichthys klamathensis goyatoka]|uniref:bifunctional apoptosis regulator-like n=1 Tax=Rhinichthys klamathensis goyatoka TaxID=3034132 RepID=UPI0024B4F16A|nr:bifunctional apoptosis regulator-like [Rhinichthys klamathensis goyatoka]